MDMVAVEAMVADMVDAADTVAEEVMEATEEREKPMLNQRLTPSLKLMLNQKQVLLLKLTQMPMHTMEVVAMEATEAMVDMEVMVVTVDMDMDANEDQLNLIMDVADMVVVMEVMVDVVVMVDMAVTDMVVK